jgi:hypothetical protein
MFAILAAVDFYERVESARLAQVAQRRILGSISGRNDWPPKPGLTVMIMMTWQRCRTYSTASRGLAGSRTTPAFLPSLADLRQYAMQMKGRRRLGMNEKVIGPGLGKI